MAKREWIGNYDYHYEWYNHHRDKWIKWSNPLGHCLGKDEAIEKAIDWIKRSNTDGTVPIRNIYITDGWGNKFYAKEN